MGGGCPLYTLSMMPVRRRSAALALLALGVAAGSAFADASLTNLNLTPLNDLGSGSYSNHIGGLYPGGSAHRPAAHAAAGISLATTQVQPRDPSGAVNVSTGKIVMISIGMSNTTQEFGSGGAGSFVPRANADPARNPALVIVDGAQGGQDATLWTNINAAAWSNVAVRLASNGVTSNQVQVAWMKQALANPSNYGAFPVHARALQAMLETIARNAKTRYPNLQLFYISSRTRAYTNGVAGLNPEPFAYEGGWATRWAVEDQINGTNTLNYSPTYGPVVAPWLAWGPYLWADGTRPRSDGFTWLPSDLQADFTHPSSSGVYKVATELLAFFKTDPTATPWFLKPTATPPAVTITPTPPRGMAPLSVVFTAVTTATNLWWTFDDGGFSTSSAPAKVFWEPGRYRVRLAAQDGPGNVAVTSTVIDVSGPFAVTTASVDGTNISISWTTTGGLDYRLQATDNLTNGFTDISPLVAAPGVGQSVTNYTAAGEAALTQRFYRIRLAP